MDDDIFESITRNPPTAKQLSYLETLGHSGPPPKSSSEASDLIGLLKAARKRKNAFVDYDSDWMGDHYDD